MIARPALVTTDITQCIRCGKTHKEIDFQSFGREPEREGRFQITHWAVCPTTHEPILTRIVLIEE